MRQWHKIKIIDLCERVISGGTPLSTNREYYENGTIPWLKTGEVTKGFVWDTETRITPLGLSNSSAKLVRTNSVIVAMYGDGHTAGNVAVNKIELATNQACCNLIVNEKIAHYLFLYYFLKASYADLVNLKFGGSQQNLNANTIKNFSVNLPPLPVQRQIAAILSAYDDLIENNTRRVALVEKMAKEVYREWFVRLRFPGHEHVPVHQGVPEGWHRVKVEALGREVRDGIQTQDLNAEMRYVGLEHIPRKSILIREWDSASTVGSDKFRFQVQDILFGKIRPYLHKVSVAHFAGVCSSDTIVIRTKRSDCRGYLYFTVFSDAFVDLAVAPHYAVTS